MSKAKTKKQEIDPSTTEVTEPSIPETIVKESVVEETIQQPDPVIEQPKEETPEVVKEELKVEKSEPTFHHTFKAPEGLEELIKPKKELDPNASFEDRITAFLDGKSGRVKLNDFLKSLWPSSKNNDPAPWLLQGNMKYLRSVLEAMVSSNKLIIFNDQHKLLGKFYHTGEDQKTCHRNLADTFIEAIV